MPDFGLFIGWGEVHPGREEQAVRVFSETLAFYDKLLEEGRIDAFEPCLLAAHGGGLRGFIILRGTHEQLSTLRLEDDFIAQIMRAELVVKDVGVEELYIGEFLEHIMELYGAQAAAVA